MADLTGKLAENNALLKDLLATLSGSDNADDESVDGRLLNYSDIVAAEKAITAAAEKTTDSAADLSTGDNDTPQLYLDFTKMIISADGDRASFPVEYLRKQLNVPDGVSDSYLTGETKTMGDIVCANRARTRAMISRALDAGYIESVPDYIWRFGLISRTAISICSDNYFCYMLMPGMGFGTVLIKGDYHAKKIIDLADRGYYVTYRLNHTFDRRPDYGKAISDEVILIPEALSSYE